MPIRTPLQPRNLALFLILSASAASAQKPAHTPAAATRSTAAAQHTLHAPPAPVVAAFVKYDTSKNTLYLDHVRVIDGTAAPPIEDATLILLDGKVAAIQPPTQMQANAGHMETWSCTDCPPALHIDLTGRTVFPGLDGMHDHMYYIALPNFEH